ncbi:MAG: permease [Nitrospirae bacterium GWC2_42_7]|nr:MAG: permease [Nitrospirae bacterium GWC2_42_7]
MLSKIFGLKQKEDCKIHGTHSKAANKTLFLMILASFSLIIWHVWIYGPTSQTANPEALQQPFPFLLGREIWDLLFNPHGLIAELWDIFPYFILGILLAGFIRTYKLALKLQTSFKKHGLLGVFLASLVGLITPLCACGTITTAVSLLFARFPLAPVMALLVTSPLLSPSTYLLTLNDLGPEWTVIRTVAAFSMGMFAGVVTLMLRDKGFQTDSIFIEGAIPRGDFHDESYPDERLRCNCKERFGHRIAARTKNMFIVFLAKSSEMLWLVGKYVLVGVAIGIVVERYIPFKWIYSLFGQKNILNIVWVTLGSVPIFLHQISASSILYHIKSSLDGTLDGGAALAFMIGGPVTAMPTMVMFWTIFKKRVFFLYMFICIVGTVLIAYTFQFFVFVPYADTGNPLLRNVSSISGGKSSIIKKQDKHVRIVMDPDAKNIIATYSNDLGGQGTVVFDAGLERFLNSSADKYDNLKYINNIAAWLEDNNSSQAQKSILIYDTFHGPGPDKSAFSRNAVTALEKNGFTVRITDRQETPEVSERLIEKYDQFWIFFGESDSGPYLSNSELEAISKFMSEGKSMLVVAGQPQNRADGLTAVNQLSSRYGIIFYGSVENQDELSAAPASYFLSRMSGVLGRILRLVNKA